MYDGCAITVAVGLQFSLRWREERWIQERTGIGTGMIGTAAAIAIAKSHNAWRRRGALRRTDQREVVVLVTKTLPGWAVRQFCALFAKAKMTTIKGE
ncbi:hypothetical protein FBU30_001967 [Linnemannia zychae]|nr:hypothetical protein FBU30_001967 [Linnemannia zychae]